MKRMRRFKRFYRYKKKKKKQDRWDINFRYNLKLYWFFLRRYLPVTILVFLVILIIEALRVADRYLFKEIIDKGTEFVAGTLIRTEFISILLIIATLFLSFRISRSVLVWIKLHFINKLDASLMKDLKVHFFNHVTGLSHGFHVTHKTGSLITRILRGSHAMERMTDVVLFNFAPLFFSLVLVIGSLIYFSWKSALILSITVLCFVGYSLIIQNMQKSAKVRANEKEDIEKGNLADFMTNIDSIKYFGKEKLIYRKYNSLAKKTKKALLRFWGYFRWLNFGQQIILGAGTFLLILFPILEFLEGEVTLGTIVFIYTIYGTTTGAMFGFVHGIRNFYRAMADFESLFRYARIEKEIKDMPDAKDLKIKKGEIEFDNVTFRYGKRTLFRNFNLKIKEDKKIALVGHSGCGKTTLVKLLYRLYDVDKGEILIDGENIKNFKQESLRNEMSIVPQECILFDDTIYNNVTFSNPRASRKEVLAAMKFAQLDNIFKYFPSKENTIVGERGVRLSGGEKQRVSIARAILANKKILVLDEATSSLDSETEHEIQKDLKKLMVGRTSLIIAHRLSTIMGADEIIVMEKGKIVQRGPHRKLITKKGSYKKLWDLQKGGYIK